MDFLQLLVRDGALLNGHFVFLKGQHASRYTNKTVAFVRGSSVDAFAMAIVDQFEDEHIETLVAPELGAISLMAHVQSHFLRRGQDVAAIVATKVREFHPDPAIAALGYSKPTKKFEISRDQPRFVEGRRVLMVEDVFSTGSSIQEALEPVRACGGLPVAAAVLMNQGDVTAESIGIARVHALIHDPVEQWFEGCPLCERRTPVNTRVGKGKEFLLTAEARALGLTAAD